MASSRRSTSESGGVGVWEATGPNSGAVTLLTPFSDGQGDGVVKWRYTLEVSSDGQSVSIDWEGALSVTVRPQENFGVLARTPVHGSTSSRWERRGTRLRPRPPPPTERSRSSVSRFARRTRLARTADIALRETSRGTSTTRPYSAFGWRRHRQSRLLINRRPPSRAVHRAITRAPNSGLPRSVAPDCGVVGLTGV